MFRVRFFALLLLPGAMISSFAVEAEEEIAILRDVPYRDGPARPGGSTWR